MSDALREAADALARGDLEAARRSLLAIAPPAREPDRRRWQLLLVEAGATDEAALEAIGPLATPPASELDAEEDELDRAELVRAAGPADADLITAFQRWFGGRPDLYARQWFDARRRRGGYRPVREPVRPEVVRAHLEGRQTMGQYLLWPDATVSFGVIDLDLGASALAELEAARGPGSAVRHPALRAFALRVLDHAGQLGVPLFASDSGRRGLHLWVFFEPRRPARAGRALLGRILDAVGPPPPDVSVELFPKQDAPGARGLSSLVKLPCGLHQVTMRPCRLLDERLAPIDDLRVGLARVRAVEPRLVDEVVGRRLVVLPRAADPTETAPPLPTATSPRGLAAALRQVPEGRPAREAALRMIDGCAVLASLVDRAYRDRALHPDEARALIYSLGLVSAAPALAIEVLGAAQAPMKELHRVRTGLPSPVGCRRLRELGATAGVACRGCPADAAASPYATPALLAVGVVPAERPRHAPFAQWLEPSDALAPDAYEDLALRLERLDERLRQLEAPQRPTERP